MTPFPRPVPVVNVFSSTRKLAQQTAHRLISGHLSLVAWWTLKHAGVLDAMRKMEADNNEGLNPLVYATRTSMSADVLAALLAYLASTNLLSMKDDQARLTVEGKALLQHEDAVLELVRSYEPVVDAIEHLLAKLKIHGGGPAQRKSETLAQSQGERYADEVFPAIHDQVTKHGFAHLLDINCGSGDLLIHLARELRNIVGVGIGADGFLTRRANAAIESAGLEKRLIAVPANPIEACTNTKSVFDRIGISRQLWEELDCIIATALFTDASLRDSDVRNGTTGVVKTLSAIPKNFPNAHLLLIEPTASPRFDRNYYAAELLLLMRLCKTTPWPAEQWREAITQANLTLVEESSLTTDGLTLFLCKPAR